MHYYATIRAMSTRLVFMGSPEFALPTLQVLAEAPYLLVGVVTQPDRPAGRGRKLTPPPIKTLALDLGLPVIQPARLKEPAAIAQLQEWAPDLIVVTAYGQILRPAVLDLPQHGCLNVHASLLPRWRGAAPIQAAILHGDPQTGTTIMRMDPGLDTGPILSQRTIAIYPDEDAGSLANRLAELGAKLLAETLPGYLAGEIQPQPQDESQVTYAPMLSKEEGRLNFNQPAESLARRVRAFTPWPGAYTLWQGQPLKILRAHAAHRSAEPTSPRNPGTHANHGGLPAIKANPGLLILDEVQPAGKRAMSGEVFLHGARGWDD